MLPFPLLPRHGQDDLVLGRLGNALFSPFVRVVALARVAHMYVIGVSGKGKSKLLEHCLCKGKGN